MTKQATKSRTHDSHEPARRVLEENQVDHAQLKAKLGENAREIAAEFKQTVIKTDREHVIKALEILKGDPELDYAMLTDITAVDNLRRPDFDPERRFTVIHIVYSVKYRKRVRLETDVPEGDQSIPSAAKVYLGAGWIEREAYDMFGIRFEGHPDLRRVLCPDYYEHHPLRKDYPLTGLGERDNFIRAEELM